MTERKAGVVRLPATTRAQVDKYATDHGLSYNAAMNVIVVAGLQALERSERR